MWYLNPQLSQDEFENLCKFICDKSNNFITFTIPDQLLKTIIYDVSMQDLENPPKNKLRKIIFKEFCMLTAEQKLKIVGSIIGRKKLSESEIYDAMLYTHDDGEKITVEKLANYLGCSARTVYRNMGNELKKEKELLNQEL
jgi:transcriptional antiterminator